MKKPSIIPPASLNIPSAEKRIMTNSSELYILRNSDQGVVRASFVFRAGTSYQSRPFCASATVNTLAEGSARLSAEEIAERLDFLGSYYDANIDRDYAVVTFCSIGKFAAETFDIAAEVVLRPAFPEKEIASYCLKRKEQLTIQRRKPDYISSELFARSIFGPEHPYGITSDQSAYDTLTREDIAEFYNSHYTAANCFAILCGHVREEDIAAVAAILNSLPSGRKVEREIPAPAPVKSERVALPDSVQSSVKIGRPLFPRSHPDFITMQVLSTALGGYFGSRLMQNLREKNGYTYGAYAATVNYDLSGYFMMGAEVAASATGRAVETMLHEAERLCRRPLPSGEMQMVRNMIFGDAQRILDGPFGVADVTIENIQNGTDNGYTERFLERVKTISPKELLMAARKYLAPENLTVTVAGPQAE